MMQIHCLLQVKVVVLVDSLMLITVEVVGLVLEQTELMVTLEMEQVYEALVTVMIS